ncbi:peptide MFS transporter [Francisella frigiditurris]|uniref:Amino acid/peptide transporter family protein n=1 Tax=Francisella frigiditurris TaxID=1542390 RepID=A0A1J0KU90_9GAMM|nr:peptide MFS transporter [Francisella frigiditurris]APC97247.1 amino acid/peptide transporter family protein [Francisella frigiditurris]
MSSHLHLKHPSGLKYLFFAEMWERFSFYGLSALLVLYMTSRLNFAEDNATVIFGSYVTYLYITTAFGGVLADRIIGYRRCVLIGGLAIMAGHIILSSLGSNSTALFLGLGCISAGTGFFKSNVSTMVGRLYDKKEALRSSGFAYFYTGINFGSVLATFIVGYVGEKIGWHYGFMLAAFGMALGLVVFEKGKKHFPESCDEPNFKVMNKKLILGITVWRLIILSVVFFAVLFGYLIAHPTSSMIVISLSGIGLFVYLSFLWRSLTTAEKTRIATLLLLSIFMLFYWSLSNQTTISIPLFIKTSVDLNIFGYQLPVTTVMGIQLTLLVIITPLFGFLWQRLSDINREPSDEIKFVLSLVFLSLSFTFLAVGGYSAINSLSYVSVLWVSAAYLMLVFGELCISPVGLALVTRVAPEHLKSTMMGVWWTISAYAGFFGGIIGSHITKDVKSDSNPTKLFSSGFFELAVAALFMAILLFIIIYLLRRFKKSPEEFQA